MSILKILLVLECVFLFLILIFLFEIFLVNEINKNKGKSECRFIKILSLFRKWRIVLLLVLICLIAGMNQTRSLKLKRSSFGKPLVMNARDPETFTPVELAPLFPDKNNKTGLMPNTSLEARRFGRNKEKVRRIRKAKKWTRKWTTLAAQKAFHFLGGGGAVMDPVTQLETSLNTPLTLGPGPQGRFGFLRSAFVSNRFHIVVVRKAIGLVYRRIYNEIIREIIIENRRRALDEANRRARQERDRRDRAEWQRLRRRAIAVMDREALEQRSRKIVEDNQRRALLESKRRAHQERYRRFREERERLNMLVQESEERKRITPD